MVALVREKALRKPVAGFRAPVAGEGDPGPHARRTIWLEEAYEAIREALLPEAPAVQQVNLVPGFPHSGARPGPTQRSTVTADKMFEGMPGRAGGIELHLKEFQDPRSCLAELLHAMIHLIVGVDKGHRRAFKSLAVRVGLEQPLAQPNPSPDLSRKIAAILDQIGPAPEGWADLPPSRRRPAWRYSCACQRPQRFQSYGKTPVEAVCPHCNHRFVVATIDMIEKTVLPAGAMDVEELSTALGKGVRTIWDRVQKGNLPAPGLYVARRAYWLAEQLDGIDTP